jgi:hypothetical protein
MGSDAAVGAASKAPLGRPPATPARPQVPLALFILADVAFQKDPVMYWSDYSYMVMSIRCGPGQGGRLGVVAAAARRRLQPQAGCSKGAPVCRPHPAVLGCRQQGGVGVSATAATPRHRPTQS